MSSSEDRDLIESIESHTATLNRHLDTLRAALRNATRDRNSELISYLHAEIEHYTNTLNDLKAQRAALRRRMR